MKLSTARPSRHRIADPIDFWLNDFLGQHPSRSDRPATSNPAVNILEHDDKFEVQLAVPGYEKEDFKIDIKDDRLIISLEDKSKAADEGVVTYRQRGFTYGPFEKSFQLNKDIDQDKIKATYEQGILSISLQKVAAAIKPEPKTIEVA